MREAEFVKLRNALVDQLMKTARFDPDKMSPKAKMLIGSAAVEFVIVAIAALPPEARRDAVRGLRDRIAVEVEAMAVTLKT
jgi:hypothetical protein